MTNLALNLLDDPFDCCCECAHFTDLFNGDDTTDLGDDWTEVAEDWEIKDHRLRVSAPDAKVNCDVVFPGGYPYSGTVKVWLYIVGDGDQLYIKIDSTWKVVFERGPALSEWRIRIYSGSNLRATRTIFCNLAEDPDYARAYVSISSEALMASIGPPTTTCVGVPIDPTEFPNGKISLGTDDLPSGPAEFDNFVIDDGIEFNEDCPGPSISCQFVHGPCDLPNGATLKAVDWTASNYLMANGSDITFTGANGSVMSNAIHPYDDASTIEVYHWYVLSIWNKIGTTFAGETGIIYFGGSTNYVKLEFIAPDMGKTWKVTVGIYIGGALSGVEVDFGNTGYPLFHVCILETSVDVAIGRAGLPVDSPFFASMVRGYVSGGVDFGVGAIDINDGLAVTELGGYITNVITGTEVSICPAAPEYPRCEPCWAGCASCIDYAGAITATVIVENVGDGTCSPCLPLEGAFEGGYLYLTDCTYKYEDEVVLCGTTYDRVITTFIEDIPPGDSTRIRVTYELYYSSSCVLGWEFRKDYDDLLDCVDATYEEISYLGLLKHCTPNNLCSPPPDVDVYFF